MALHKTDGTAWADASSSVGSITATTPAATTLAVTMRDHPAEMVISDHPGR
jgi:hypothetical protein